VAAGAEVLGLRRDAAGLRAVVTVDAALQAVLRGADALKHRLVTVMVEHLHVVAAHVVGVFHALLTLDGPLDDRLGRAGMGRRHAGQGQDCRQQQPCHPA